MKKIFLFILFSAFFIPNAFGVARIEPSCFVVAEVRETGSETGGDFYLNIKVLGVDNPSDCPAKAGQVFRIPVSAIGDLKNGDRIQAAITSAFTTTAEGTSDFFFWSGFTYEDGREIPGFLEAADADVTALQASSEPLSFEEATEEVAVIRKEKNETVQEPVLQNKKTERPLSSYGNILIYFYFFASLVVVLGIILFLRKSKK